MVSAAHETPPDNRQLSYCRPAKVQPCACTSAHASHLIGPFDGRVVSTWHVDQLCVFCLRVPLHGRVLLTSPHSHAPFEASSCSGVHQKLFPSFLLSSPLYLVQHARSAVGVPRW